MTLFFHVPGVPIGKARARVLKSGRSYTPAKTVAYEAHIAACANGERGDVFYDGPVALVLDVAFPIPASWSKRKQVSALEGGIAPTCKPDLDNVAKAFGDALNGVLWRDDSQVVSLSVAKRYGVAPGVWVRAESA